MEYKKYKVCTDCKVKRKIEDFYWRQDKRYKKSHCKKCSTKRTAKWVGKNREKFNLYHSKYRKAHESKM